MHRGLMLHLHGTPYNFGCFGLPELKMVDPLHGHAIHLIWQSPATISMTARTNTPVFDRQGGMGSPCIVDIIGILIDFEYKGLSPLRLYCNLLQSTCQKSRSLNGIEGE
jgi:hypothetical protein